MQTPAIYEPVAAANALPSPVGSSAAASGLAGYEGNRHGAGVFFSLEPRGLGTGDVESILSYTRRLAEAHVLGVTWMVRKLVLEPLRRERGQRCLLFDPTKATESLSGYGRTPESYADRLSVLTLRPDLRRCTLIGAEGVALETHWRRERSWCPPCLDEDEPYDRLAWGLSTFRVCVTHAAELRSNCSGCGKSHRPLAVGAACGYCPHCGRRLGERTGATVMVDALSRGTYEFVAEHAAGLTIGPGVVTAALRAATQGWGARSQLARRVGVGSSSITRYVRGYGRPRLDVLLRIVAAGGSGLAAFADHVPVALVSAPKSAMSEEFARRVEADLKQALAAEDHELVSLRTIARRHGVSSGLFSRRFKDLTDELVTRRRAYAARRHIATEAAREQRVRDTVRLLRTKHTHITRRMVEGALTHQGLLRSPQLRAVAKEEMERV